MAAQRRGPGGGGMFHSLDTLPLFHADGPVRRYGSKGYDLVNSIPPLYTFAVALVLLFTSIGLMSSLANANAQVADMSEVLVGLRQQLGMEDSLHQEAQGTANTYSEALQDKIEALQALETEKADLESKLSGAESSLATLQQTLGELRAEQSNCSATITALTASIKTRVRNGLRHEQEVLLAYIESLTPGGPEEEVAATPTATPTPAEE
mmetsp:Transcript_9806/g.17651  ORF Transcript_9806/g.17651 Transcript_9806/m.17651 type:complete len:209 (-) Transcript_9806:126-752(-)